MICLDEGILRAYLDGELSRYETLSVDRHISLCNECHDLHQALMARQKFLSPAFAILEPGPGELRVDTFAAQCAFTRFKAQYDISFEQPVYAGAATRELRFLLPYESLLTRLAQQFRANWEDFKRDPQLFLHFLLHGEGNTPVRRRRLQKGTAAAMASYALLFTSLIIAGVVRNANKPEVEAPEPYKIIRLASPPVLESEPKSPPEYAPSGDRRGLAGGDRAISDPATGGGGGGREARERASRGQMPQFSPIPQLLPPQAEPGINPAALVIPETLSSDPALSRRVPGRSGLSDGSDSASPGPGRTAGLGDSQGTGLGPGTGPGGGPGSGGNRGRGESRSGGGLGNTPEPGIDSIGEIFEATGSLQPQIIYREKARYTEDARSHSIRGTVLMSAVFGSDGRLYEIRTLRPLPYGLTESAVVAVQKIKFRPAIRNGQPVSVRMQLEFNFNLF